MKQYINKHQILDLTESVQKSLIQCYSQHQKENNINNLTTVNDIPLLSIGHLINIIEDKTGYPIKIYPKNASLEEELNENFYYIIKTNIIKFIKNPEKEGYIKVFHNHRELIDTLWEAVIFIINLENNIYGDEK